MSHDIATVTFPDGLVLHTEYDGTCGIARLVLFDTKAEMLENWRKDVPDGLHCSCGKEEPVEYHTAYGGGIDWVSSACRHCKVLTGPRDQFPVYDRQPIFGGY
jgi:hypothetical protein